MVLSMASCNKDLSNAVGTEPPLTAQFNPDEVFDAKVFQEHPGGGSGFEHEGDVCT